MTESPTRAGSRGGCLPWSLGCLTLVLFAIFAPIFLCFEEDLRGAHAWAVTRAHWEARGISFDPRTYYPATVPDKQNLAALPIFRAWPDRQASGALEPIELIRSLDSRFHGGSLPLLRDHDRIAANVAKLYAKGFNGAGPLTDPLDQLEALYPILPPLMVSAKTRPLCRFGEDYTTNPPWERSFGLLTEQIPLCHLLTLHAMLALREKRADAALDDIKVSLQLAAGAGKDPTLVGSLVSIAIVAITREGIDRGLADHDWSDAQLAELQVELHEPDFLAQYQFALRGETITQTVPMYAMVKKNRASFLKDWTTSLSLSAGDSPKTRQALFLDMWPSGWWDMNTALAADFNLSEAEGVDPSAHRASPETNEQLNEDARNSRRGFGWLAPWRMLSAVSAPAMGDAEIKFARIQVSLDQDQIVCALERYRLVHGAYPAALDALVPADIDRLPRDILNGEPYRYRLNEDGTFLLYSVGWNLADDGGRVEYKSGKPEVVDDEQGDWVWLGAK